MKTPTTAEELQTNFAKFMQRWNFPNGIEAVDGKHIVIQQPKNSGWLYRNYKGIDSIILLGMIGPEYKFLYADVGMNGRNRDGRNCSQNQLKNTLENNKLNIPKPRALPGRIKKVPYVCTGDDAFPLSKFLMKLHSQKNVTVEKRIFG